MYHDKTKYDEKVAEFITDYIDLAKRLKRLVKKKRARVTEIKGILEEYCKSAFNSGEPRKYIELLRGRKVVRIERKDDPDAISQKWADYSSGIIEKLLDQGLKDAMTALGLKR
ncbi:MAG: hypothetical protein WAM26_12560 [Nitrososphaeraceae archaeon]